MNLAKSLIGSEKLFQSSRTYAVKWQFSPKILPSGKLDPSDTQGQSMLIDSNSGLEKPPIQSI
jgi:hypothetical protein